MTLDLVAPVQVSPMLDTSSLRAAIPTHLGSTRPSLDPYGHLLKVLMPGASGIAVYDARGTPLGLELGRRASLLREMPTSAHLQERRWMTPERGRGDA